MQGEVRGRHDNAGHVIVPLRRQLDERGTATLEVECWTVDGGLHIQRQRPEADAGNAKLVRCPVGG